MPHPLRIAVISDSRNQRLAECYGQQLAETTHVRIPVMHHSFSLLSPEKTARVLENSLTALAPLGIPGLPDYARQIHGFMDALAMARHQPPIGFFSHDEAHTRHVLHQWLDQDRRGQSIPSGILHIIDASRRLNLSMLQTALDILTHNARVLSENSSSFPISRVSVETLRQLEFAGDRKR